MTLLSSKLSGYNWRVRNKKVSARGCAETYSERNLYGPPYIRMKTPGLGRKVHFRIPPGRPRRPPQRSPRGRRAGKWLSSQPQEPEGADLLSSNPSCYLQSKKQNPQRQMRRNFFFENCPQQNTASVCGAKRSPFIGPSRGLVS